MNEVYNWWRKKRDDTWDDDVEGDRVNGGDDEISAVRSQEEIDGGKGDGGDGLWARRTVHSD